MRTLTTMFLLMLVAIPAHAYDMADLRRDMHAHIDKMMKDAGDLTIEHEATFEGGAKGASGMKGMTGMKTTTYVKGTRWRSNAVMQGGDDSPSIEMVSMFDGEDLWTVVMGMKQKQPRGTIGQTGQGGMWNEFPDDAKLVGEDQVGGRATWKVQYEPEKGGPKGSQGPVLVWVDKSTFVPIQLEAKSSGKPMRMVMSDFRKVKGYDYPYLTELFADGQKSMTLKVVKLETNKGVSDDLFDPEKLAGGEGMDMNAMMKKAMEMQKQMEQSNKKGDQ